MIRALAHKEIRSFFASPLAWVILAVASFILSWIFLVQVDLFLRVMPRLALYPHTAGVTALVAMPLLHSATIILLLITPLVTMRLISEERRQQTLTLLYSSPIRVTEVVLGKYLGVLGFLCVLLALIVLMPLSLALGTQLDWGLLAAGVLGLALVMAAFAAAGLYLSSLTEQPTLAAISSFGLLLFLWIISWAARGHGPGSHILRYVSLLNHFSAFMRGEVKVSDVLYYLLFILLFLTLTIRRLDADRLEH